MIATALLQVVVTVWMGAHPERPITYTIPKLYPVTNNSCQEAAEALFARRKDKSTRMKIECVPTAGRDA